MPNCLTLLTDFGLSDPYVGVMKGAIAQVNPTLNVIDLTHQISPQDVAAARFALMTAFPYFPTGTVHVAVVDPGVGSQRRAIALALGSDPSQPQAFLVGPDNGLFSGVLSQVPGIAAVELTNPQYWRTLDPSHTFHGRDLFAPVGAHLASGVPLAALGKEIALDTLVQLNVPECQIQPLGGGDSLGASPHRQFKITGCIQAIDHFGNLISNIPATAVLGQDWSVAIHGYTLPGKPTYSDSPLGELLALIGSHGWIEIALNHGSAQAKLGLDWGDKISVIVSANN